MENHCAAADRSLAFLFGLRGRRCQGLSGVVVNKLAGWQSPASHVKAPSVTRLYSTSLPTSTRSVPANAAYEYKLTTCGWISNNSYDEHTILILLGW